MPVEPLGVLFGERLLDWRAELASLGRLLLVTPGTPQDRVDFLRKQIAEILADPQFLTEMKKVNLAVTYASPDVVETMIARVMRTLDSKSLAEVKDITLNRYY